MTSATVALVITPSAILTSSVTSSVNVTLRVCVTTVIEVVAVALATITPAVASAASASVAVAARRRRDTHRRATQRCVNHLRGRTFHIDGVHVRRTRVAQRGLKYDRVVAIAALANPCIIAMSIVIG